MMANIDFLDMCRVSIVLFFHCDIFENMGVTPPGKMQRHRENPMRGRALWGFRRVFPQDAHAGAPLRKYPTAFGAPSIPDMVGLQIFPGYQQNCPAQQQHLPLNDISSKQGHQDLKNDRVENWIYRSANT